MIDDPFPGSDSFRGVDPTLGGINRLYTTATNQHLRDNLGVDSESHYELLNYDVNSRWQWRDEKTGSPIPVGATEDLAVGLGMNPDMKLSVVHGVYDLVTPYFESKYLVNQLRRGSKLANSILLQNYEGGHMFFVQDPAAQPDILEGARTQAVMEAAFASAAGGTWAQVPEV